MQIKALDNIFIMSFITGGFCTGRYIQKRNISMSRFVLSVGGSSGSNTEDDDIASRVAAAFTKQRSRYSKCFPSMFSLLIVEVVPFLMMYVDCKGAF